MTRQIPRMLQPAIHVVMQFWQRIAGRELGVCAMIVDAEQRVLLVRHSYTQGWFLPGGAVERGESAAEAVAREIHEECGVELTAPAILFGTYRGRRGGPRNLIALFLVRDFRQPSKPKPNWEIIDSGFFSRTDLPQGTSRAALRRLAELFDGTERAEFW